MEEVVHFLHADRTIFVGVHRFEDAFVSSLKLLQGDGSVTIAIHQREDDAHGERLHHTSLSHGVPHQVLAHHIVPAHALPHAMPQHSMPIRIAVFSLVDGVLLRLLHLLHGWVIVVAVLLSVRRKSAEGQNECSSNYHEKVSLHGYLHWRHRICRRH
jgi:hypothetical protein